MSSQTVSVMLFSECGADLESMASINYCVVDYAGHFLYNHRRLLLEASQSSAVVQKTERYLN